MSYYTKKTIPILSKSFTSFYTYQFNIRTHLVQCFNWCVSLVISESDSY